MNVTPAGWLWIMSPITCTLLMWAYDMWIYNLQMWKILAQQMALSINFEVLFCMLSHLNSTRLRETEGEVLPGSNLLWRWWLGWSMQSVSCVIITNLTKLIVSNCIMSSVVLHTGPVHIWMTHSDKRERWSSPPSANETIIASGSLQVKGKS